MRKRFIIYWIALAMLSIIACSENENKQEQVAKLEQTKFVEVLTDVRLLEAMYTLKYQRIDSTGGLMDEYYQQIWDKYQIKQDDFKTSYVLYAKNAAVMEVIEDSVIKRLERMSGALNKTE